MKIRLFFTMTLLLCIAGRGMSQEARQKYLDVETGLDFLSSNLLFKDNIRGEMPQYYSMDESGRHVSNVYFKDYLGVKAEIFSLNQKLSFSAGLRYTRGHSYLGKNTYSSSSTFFYLLYRQDGTTTEYLKVRDISQKSDYAGIPLEFRFFAFPLEPFLFYLKAGVEFDFRMQTRTDVKFYDSAMNSYRSDISNLVGTPRSFTSSLYGMVGISWGKPFKPTINIEVSLPTVFLTPETSGLVNPEAGTGIRLTILVPFKSKAQ